MVGALVMWRHVIDRALEEDAIVRESLSQLRRVVIRHHRDFISRFELRQCILRGPSDFLAKRIQTTTTIDQQKHRQRKRVLTEMRDRLPAAIFGQKKVLLFQTTD